MIKFIVLIALLATFPAKSRVPIVEFSNSLLDASPLNDIRPHPTHHSSLLLTECSFQQYRQAVSFQETCKDSGEIDPTYCPLLSYFRYCDPAKSTTGLVPIKPNYKNVYFKTD